MKVLTRVFQRYSCELMQPKSSQDRIRVEPYHASLQIWDRSLNDEIQTHLSTLNGVTISGNVIFCAIVLGTPTVSIGRFGSGVITVRAEKSTRLPIRLPRMRPSLPFNRCFIDFNGRPPFCVACNSTLPAASASSIAEKCYCGVAKRELVCTHFPFP